MKRALILGAALAIATACGSDDDEQAFDEPRSFTLDVTVSGDGVGEVSSEPEGLDCGLDCSAEFEEGAIVWLTATARDGSKFAGWSVGCTGAETTCRVSITDDLSVVATFDLLEPEEPVDPPVKEPIHHSLEVSVTGEGAGEVTSQPEGIDCEDVCSAEIEEGSTVDLTATPAPGSVFAGWTGACAGIEPTCGVVVSEDTVVGAAFEPVTFEIVVTLLGDGAGTVTSEPTGIDCGEACAATFSEGTSVTLVATPRAGSVFLGWGGACDGVQSTCETEISNDLSVNASFGAVWHTLLVGVSGEGDGVVTSEPEGVDCDGACSAEFRDGTDVVLTATATDGSRFVGWSGACIGLEPSCRIEIVEEVAVLAEFERIFHPLTIDVSGQGEGGIASAPHGIDCGPNCYAEYAEGTDVTLIATPARGSLFAGWTGACQGEEPTCELTVTEALGVGASFELGPKTLAVSLLGEGEGAVTSSPQGLIDCAPGCTAQMEHGSLVTLTAAAADWSSFVGWGGACGGRDATCDLTLSADTGVTATFEISTPEGVHALPGDESVAIVWEPVPGASHAVYWGTSPDLHPDVEGSFDGVAVEVVSPKVFGGLSNFSTYYYAVTALKGGVRSAPSEVVMAMPHPPAIRPLNDTGITSCGDYAADGSGFHQNDLDCAATGASAVSSGVDADGDPVPPGQDAHFGWDRLASLGELSKVGAGAAGFDFSKVCGSGDEAGVGDCPADPALGSNRNEWACTRDNRTGLLWELKTAHGLHSAASVYSWYDEDTSSNGGLPGTPDSGWCQESACDTQAFMREVNGRELCGSDQWRLPTVGELSSIVHAGAAQPAIDGNYFPNTMSDWYWTSVTRAGTQSRWFVDFEDGSVASNNSPIHVRAVSGGVPLDPAAATACTGGANSSVPATTPTDEFFPFDDGTVIHLATGLMWMRCALGQTWNGTGCEGAASSYTWLEALEAAVGVNEGTLDDDGDGVAGFAGYRDWRLPNSKELGSILELRCSQLPFNAVAFPDAPASVFYWSSSPDVSDGERVWISTGHGAHPVSQIKGTSSYRVRLARTVYD